MNHTTKSLLSLVAVACMATTLQADCSAGSCRSQEYRTYRSPEYRNDHRYKEVIEATSAFTDKSEDYSFYGRGQRIGRSMIRAFALLARGDVKRSARIKDSVFKKHVDNLSKIKKHLDLPWFFWGSEPLKTENKNKHSKMHVIITRALVKSLNLLTLELTYISIMLKNKEHRSLLKLRILWHKDVLTLQL